MRKKHFLSACIVGVCLLGLCGCSDKNKSADTDEKSKESSQQTKIINGYEEIRYDMPQGMTWIPPLAAGMTKEDELIVLGAKEDFYYIWTSEDYGKTWGEPVKLPDGLQPSGTEEAAEAGQENILSASISSDGTVALIRARYYDEINRTCDYWTWKPGEQEKKLEIELEADEFYTNHSRAMDTVCVKPSAFTMWKYTEEGMLLAEAMNGQVFLVNPENGQTEVQTAYVQGTKQILYSKVVDGKIIVQTSDGIFSYQKENGEFVETDKGLQSDITELTGTREYSYVGNSCEIFMKDGKVYEVGETGLYEGKGESRSQIIPGTDAVIGNNLTRYLNAYKVEEKNFVIPCVENGKYFVMYYHYTGEKEAEKKKGRLTIYTLRDNDNISQAAELYNNEHPGVEIVIERGLSDEGNVTVSDAVRSLSTRIMAGDGPDLILLDEMAAETYIEKGILADITDIYNKVDEEEGLLKNVAGAYKKGKKVYAITTHFYVPVLMGKENDIESVKDLKSLENTIDRLIREDKVVFTDKTVRSILNYSVSISSPDWLDKGKLKEKELKQFLESVKHICEMTGVGEGSYDADSSTEDFRDDFLHPVYYACGVDNMTMGMVKGFSDISQMSSAVKKAGEGTWKLQNGQAENVFVPSAIVGISGRAGNKEEAAAFLEYLLTSEIQIREAGSGFPVNLTAIKRLSEEEPDKKQQSIMMSTESGETLELDVKPAESEEVQKFCKMIETVDTPEVTDQVVLQTVKKYALSYMKGDTSLDKAMEDIKSRVNLHLAE